jgi:chondroitin-sulfate-ABC endolyase/exolyase
MIGICQIVLKFYFTNTLKTLSRKIKFISYFFLLICQINYSQNTRKPAIESFEDARVVDKYVATNSTISIVDRHFKYGKAALKWSWNKEANFGTSNFKILSLEESPLAYGSYFPASPTLHINIYNEVSQNGNITISFEKNKKKEIYFDIPLNFKGWRKFWIPFYEMNGNAPKKGEQIDFDYFKVTTNSKSGTLYFDDIIFSQYQDDRHQYPDNLVPFIKKDSVLREDFWMPSSTNYKNIQNLKAKPISVATRLDLKKFEQKIKEDLTVAAKYKTYINSLREDFDALGIYEEDAIIKGPPLTFYDEQEYFNENQQGKKVHNDLRKFEKIMRKLSHFHERSTIEEQKAIEEMFILGTKYFLDQGWQEGSNGGTRHHIGYFIRGVAEGFFTMRKVLYDNGLLTDVANSMHWVFNLGKVLEDQSTFTVNIDYLNTQAYYHLMLIFLEESQEKQVALLQAYSNYLSITLAQKNEQWGFKEDGTAWHHNGHYPAYGIGAFRNVPKPLNILSKTRFRITTAGHQNFKNAFMAARIYSQKFDWGFGNAGRHPLEENGIKSLKNQFLLMANAGDPTAKAEIDTEVAAAYLRLWGDEDKFNRALFSQMNAIKKEDVTGFYTFPYAATAIKRTKEWAAIIKGYSKYVWASEIYVDENRYGRYPSNGTIQLLNKKGENGSGFKQEGWDWNRYPGATIIYLPFKELEPKKLLLAFRSNETFAGATELNGNGIFGMILNEADGSNADGEIGNNGFPGKLKAKKSIFSFSDKIISIGTNISSVDNKNPTQTNLFQTFLEDKKELLFTQNGKLKSFPTKGNLPANKTGENWIIDNYGNGYHILSSDVINYKKETQNSYHNKYSVNTGKMNAKGKGVTKTKGNYATAWINHGLAPKNANYQYIIYPFNTESEIDDFEEKVKKDTSYTIIQADENAHIVKDEKTNTTGYVIFDKNFKLKEGLLKSVSKPSLLMTQNLSATKIEISLVQPDLNFEEYSKNRFKNFSRPVELIITIKNKWEVAKKEFIKSISYKEGMTIITLTCKDGLPRKFVLNKLK